MKKLFLALAAAAMFTLPANVSATAYPRGDLNCSGSVTSLDISIETYMVAGGANPFECGQSADLNCSGALTSADISIMMFIAAGGIYAPPPGC